MGEAYSEIGMKGEVSPAVLPTESPGGTALHCHSLAAQPQLCVAALQEEAPTLQSPYRHSWEQLPLPCSNHRGRCTSKPAVQLWHYSSQERGCELWPISNSSYLHTAAAPLGALNDVKGKAFGEQKIWHLPQLRRQRAWHR